MDYNLASREVFSKEKFIRALASSLHLKHEHCPSIPLETIDQTRANCLGLDVSQAEKILGKKMPTLSETVASIKEDFDRYKLKDQ